MIDDNKIKIDEGKRRIGKDEMNLVEIPFTLLTARNPKGLKTIERKWISKGADGKEKKFSKIITGSDKWGLPTFIGEEVYLACMELSYRQGFESRTIYTSKRQILELMGWGGGGLDYKRLIKAFNQLLGITITTNAFWDNEQKKYIEIGFGIVDDYMFFEDEKRKSRYGQDPLPLGNFNWNEKFFNNTIKKGNIKTLDIAFYFSLKSYTSKRLYRFADKKLYNQHSFELDLFRLAFEKMEMVGRAYKYPSKIIQNLKPAIAELKERDIFDIQIKPSSTPSGHKVCFHRIIKSQIAVPEQLPDTQTTIQAPQTAINLVKYFHSYIDPNTENYTPSSKEIKQAESLISEHGEEKAKHIVEFAVKKAKETNFDIQWFGAVMSYASKAIGKLEQKAGHIREEEIRQLEGDYEFYRMEQSEEYKNSLPADELKKLSAQYEKIFLEKHTWYQKLTEEKRQESVIYQDTLTSFFNDWLITEGIVKTFTFENWKAQTTDSREKAKVATALRADDTARSGEC